MLQRHNLSLEHANSLTTPGTIVPWREAGGAVGVSYAQLWLADRLSLTALGSVCRNDHGLLLPVRPRGLSLEMQKREKLSKASVVSRRAAFAVIPAKLGCVEDCL
jgi:hypothetical protein